MTEAEFIKAAKYLVQKYVSDKKISEAILKDIDDLGSSAAKGILSDICENSADIEIDDGKIIRDIAYNFA